jgi:hypothetical protein
MTDETPVKSGRKLTGQVITRTTKNGTSYGYRVTAFGKRHTVTLGTGSGGWTRERARQELEAALVDIRRGTWSALARQLVEEPTATPTFHEFASAWYERHRREVRERTTEYWRELLSPHLLPYFADYPLDRITPELVDQYKTAKLRERERWDKATPEERKRRGCPSGARPGPDQP